MLVLLLLLLFLYFRLIRLLILIQILELTVLFLFQEFSILDLINEIPKDEFCEKVIIFLENSSDFETLENLAEKIVLIVKKKKESKEKSNEKSTETVTVETCNGNETEENLEKDDSNLKSMDEVVQNVAKTKIDGNKEQTGEISPEQEALIEKASHLKWPENKKKQPGRPVGSKKMNAIGMEIGNEKKNFSEKTQEQKKSCMIYFLLKENTFKKEKAHTKEYKIKSADITPQKLQHFLSMSTTDLNLLHGHFEKGTEENFLKSINETSKKNLVMCAACENKIKSEDVIECKSCLLRFDLQCCTGYRRARKNSWYCKLCTKLFQDNTNRFC